MNSSTGKCAVLILLACFFTVAVAADVHAQSQSISGNVVDPSGAVIKNANVQITDEEKKIVVREVTTDDDGRFQALSIQPGIYSLSVEAQGFKKLVSSNNQLEVNTKLDVGDLKLEIGELTDTAIQITEQTPQVQTNTMEKSYAVENAQIQELPLNGRNWVSLISTIPGVTSTAASDFNVNFNDVSSLHVNGGRGSQNNFYLDGSPNLDVGDNQSQYTQPSVYSIGEFKVQQSSFNAEYGRNSGIVVAVQTKSGGSSFHGTAYEYVRNDAFDARRPDNIIKDKLRYNLFGGNISGWIPIPKISTKDNKKLFFFYNREMTRRQVVSSGSSYIDLPGAATLERGDFSSYLKPGVQMPYAPFPVGTIFQPGTVRYDSAGNITGGTPFPNNVVPTSLWNPKTANLLKLFTQVPGFSGFPASPNPGLVRWFFSSPNKLEKDQDLLRVDYTLNSTTTTFFRWVNDDQTEFQPQAIWGWSSFAAFPPIGPSQRPKPGSSWSWNIVKAISPTLASETILSYNHQSQSLTPSDNSVDRDALGLNFPQLYPGTNTANFAPNFQAPGGNSVPGITLAWGSPGWHNDGKAYAFTQNLSWVKNSHTLKFGFFYNRDNKKQTANFGSAQGELNFSSGPNNPNDTGVPLANLMLGGLSAYTQASASIYPYFRFQSWEGFAQDSWKVNPRLTLEYGLRFQRTTPTYTYVRDGDPGGEGTFRLYSVDLTRYSAATAPQINLTNGLIVGDALSQYLANGLICDPCDGVERGFAETKNFLSPRVGFAYDVFGDGKTALRGGFGQYIERLRQNNFNFGAGAQFPNGVGFGVFNTSINNVTPGPTGGVIGASIAPQGYNIFPVGNTMPTIYSWNLGVQRELAYNFSLDLSYVGNRGIHLMVQRAINGTPANYFIDNPNALPSVNNYADALRPYRGYGGLTSIETSGTSSYHGMLVRLSRRFTNSFSFNVNYSWSRTFDIVDNDSDSLVNPLDVRANWAPAGYDATHTFSVDYVYELPRVRGALDNRLGRAVFNGWQLSGITRAQSGFPLNVTSNGTLYGIDAGTQYVDLIGDPYAGQTKERWLNPAAFARPLDGRRGNLHRNALRGPGFNNWDVSLSKIFRFKEAMSLKLGMDVFNVFNHAQVYAINTGFSADTPGSGISSSTRNTFGTIGSFRDPRILQFGARFEF